MIRYDIFAFQSGGNLRGGKHSELRSPLFPLALPLSGHAILSYAVGMCQCIGTAMDSTVLVMLC